MSMYTNVVFFFFFFCLCVTLSIKGLNLNKMGSLISFLSFVFPEESPKVKGDRTYRRNFI